MMLRVLWTPGHKGLFAEKLRSLPSPGKPSTHGWRGGGRSVPTCLLRQEDKVRGHARAVCPRSQGEGNSARRSHSPLQRKVWRAPGQATLKRCLGLWPVQSPRETEAQGKTRLSPSSQPPGFLTQRGPSLPPLGRASRRALPSSWVIPGYLGSRCPPGRLSPALSSPCLPRLQRCLHVGTP